MKKDKQWAISELTKSINFFKAAARNGFSIDYFYGKELGTREAIQILEKLDEPETLTPEWIDERIHYSTDQDAFGNIVRIEMVPAKYLQNLLVPKQEYFLDTLEDGVYAVKDGRIERGNIATEYTNKETEVLSQKWIDDNSVYASSDGITEEYVHVDDLKELLVPKQESPVIPHFVAKWIEEYIEYGHDLYPALKKMENNSRAWKKTYDWYRKNTHTFVNAYLTGKYEVEERELTVKKVIEEHIELLKKQEVAVNLKPYYDLWEELKDE